MTGLTAHPVPSSHEDEAPTAAAELKIIQVSSWRLSPLEGTPTAAAELKITQRLTAARAAGYAEPGRPAGHHRDACRGRVRGGLALVPAAAASAEHPGRARARPSRAARRTSDLHPAAHAAYRPGSACRAGTTWDCTVRTARAVGLGPGRAATPPGLGRPGKLRTQVQRTVRAVRSCGAVSPGGPASGGE